MDGRHALVLVLGLAAGGGCTTLSTQSGPIGPIAEAPATDDAPKQHLKPATFVAFGQLNEQAAAEKDIAPSAREQLHTHARKAYEHTLTVDPKNVAALTGLGRIYAADGNFDAAVVSYRKAAALTPKDAAVWYALGMCQARQREWSGAVESLEAAAKLDSANKQYVNALGFCLARAGRYDDVCGTFRKVSGEAEAHYKLARVLYQDHQEDLSRQHLEQALQANPQLVAARDLLARIENPTPDAPESPAETTGSEQVQQ